MNEVKSLTLNGKTYDSFPDKTAVKTVNGITPDKNGNVQIGLPEVYGLVDENNNILLTGALAKGTYTFKYENGDGNLVTIGSYTATEDSPGADPGGDPDTGGGEDTGGEEAAVYGATIGKAVYEAADGNKVYHDTTGSMQSFATVHEVSNRPGVYADASYTTESDIVKPISVPAGKTSFRVVLPNAPQDYLFRCFAVAMSYDENASCWIKTGITANSDYLYTAAENTIPSNAEYLLINIDAAKYEGDELKKYQPWAAGYFEGVEVEWL